MGLVLGPHAYLRDGWNVLDGFIVVISVITLFGAEALKPLRVMRAFRGVRPLRLISRLEGLKARSLLGSTSPSRGCAVAAGCATQRALLSRVRAAAAAGPRGSRVSGERGASPSPPSSRPRGVCRWLGLLSERRRQEQRSVCLSCFC